MMGIFFWRPRDIFSQFFFQARLMNFTFDMDIRSVKITF